MNRRTLLQAVPVVAGAIWLGAAAQEARAASPVSSPAASTLPQTYLDVAQQYNQLAAQLLDQGRTVIEMLLHGKTAELFDRFSPEMQQLVPEADLATIVPSFETNRAHFEVDEFGLVFDAHVDGSVMSGTLQSDDPLPFTLARNEESDRVTSSSPTTASPAPAAHPLEGTWEGSVLISQDGTSVEFVITIEQDGATGSLSVPEQQLFDAALTNIWFQQSMPIETRLNDRGLPHSPDMQFYWARYGWGDRTIIFNIVFDAEGAIRDALLVPEWLLPPDPAANLAALAPMRLPFDELWWIIWGGVTTPENYHAPDPAQRHALDLAIWNAGGTFHGDGAQNEDYWIWGAPVLAPAAGTVTTVLDGIATNPPGTSLPDVHIAGNHVVLNIGQDAYIYLAHLQQDSIVVAEGAVVAAGDLIGLAGNSGNSSEPHLHIHVQNEPDLLSPTAFGLPITFADVLVNGEPVSDARLEQGSFVAPA